MGVTDIKMAPGLPALVQAQPLLSRPRPQRADLSRCLYKDCVGPEWRLQRMLQFLPGLVNKETTTKPPLSGKVSDHAVGMDAQVCRCV